MKFINANEAQATLELENPAEYIGKTITLHGSIYRIREMSGFAFVLLRTAREIVQCLYLPGVARFALAELKDEMCVRITGEVVAEPRSRTGAELHIHGYELLSAPAAPPPVVINGKQLGLSLENTLDLRPVTLRNARERAIFRLQGGICRALRIFFDSNGFTEIHSPKLVCGGAEGGANIFSLDYFGKRGYLTQSPQLYKQMMVGVFERVYEIGPVFRAEKHDTSRHLSENTSVDLEMGFITDFYDIMRLEAQMLSELFGFLREHYARELELLGAEMPQAGQIPAVTFAQAKEIIAERREVTDWHDFDPEEEKILCDAMKSRTGSEFVFVTHYPSAKRPFYAMDTKGEEDVTESFDLLFRGVEITTGGQRIHDYAGQVEKMRSRGMNPDDFEGYLLAHRHGLPPHGGLGLGLERLTARLLNLPNVRLATLFPRDTTRLTP